MKPLEQVLQPFLYFLTAVGAFPLVVTPRLAASKCLKIYSLVLSIAFVSATLVITTYDLPSGGGFLTSVIRVMPTIGTTMTLAMIAMPTCNTHLTADMYRRFNKADLKLQDVEVFRDDRRTLRIPLMYLGFNLVYLTVYVATEFMFPFWIIKFPIYAQFVYITNFSMLALITHTSTLSFLLTNRYRLLNTKLEEIETSLKRFKKVRNLKLISSNTHDNRIFEMFSDFDRVQKRANYSGTAKTIDQIKNLQKCSFELAQISSSMGWLFTPPVVLTVLYTSIELLITTYTAFAMVLYGDEYSVVQLATCIKWVVIDIIRILSLLLAFTSIERELMKFSQQLTHHKLNFSTCGLFSLDMSLLVSIAGALTTYLVILLQFANPAINNSQQQEPMISNIV